MSEPTGHYWIEDASSSTPNAVANVCGSDAREVRDENGLLVAVFVNGEDAAMFVRCVNAHDELVGNVRFMHFDGTGVSIGPDSDTGETLIIGIDQQGDTSGRPLKVYLNDAPVALVQIGEEGEDNE